MRSAAPLLLTLCLLLSLPAHSQTTAAQTRPAATASAPTPSGSTTSPKAQRQAVTLYARGANAEEKNDPRQAMEFLDQAVAFDPQNPIYRAAALLARDHLIAQLIHQAEDARRLGDDQLVRIRLEEAIEIDPKNPVANQHYDELVRLKSKTPDQIRSHKIDFMGSEMHFLPKPGTHSFHLKMTRRDLVIKVYHEYGINAQCDDSVPPRLDRFDMEDASFETVQRALRLATHTYAVPLDPDHALIVADTRESLDRFERMETETFYLPGLSSAELTDIANMVKNVFGLESASTLASKGTMTLRAHESVMPALRMTLRDLIEGRDQVQLQVRLIEINKIKSRETGIAMPQSIGAFNFYTAAQSVISANQSIVNQMISAGIVQPGDWATIAAYLILGGYGGSSLLAQPFATFGGGITESAITFGSVTGKLALNSSNTRTLDDIQLRITDQESGTVRSGTRYPIVTSQYSSGANTSLPNIPGLNTAAYSSELAALGLSVTGSSTTATVPQVQYEDLGLTLKATPHVLRSGDIELNLDLQIAALAGSTNDDIPILDNRHFTTVTTLKTGESTMLVGYLNRQENKAVSGDPGLSDIPGLNDVASDKSKDINETVLSVVITPTLIRGTHHEAAGSMVLIPTQAIR
jgi:Flp pilus assembly secretin CpaC